MKSVLKIMKQPPRVVRPKPAAHTTNNKKSKILEELPQTGPTKTADMQPAALLDMNPPQEFPKYT